MHNPIMVFGHAGDCDTVRMFENRIEIYHDCYAVCVSSATVGLEMVYEYAMQKRALLRDSITVPHYSQISTIHALIRAGAGMLRCSDSPDVAVDLNGRVSAGGIIADSAQSSLTNGVVERRLAAVLSFGAMKIISGGVGGAVLTRDRDLYEWIIEMKNYGKKDGKSDIDIVRVGTNARMSGLCAEYAMEQWGMRDAIIEDRWRVYDWYVERLGSEVIVPFSRSEDVPWMIEARVSDAVMQSGLFRQYYPPWRHYRHLEPYFDDWNDIQGVEYKHIVYLPSEYHVSVDHMESAVADIERMK